MERQDGICTASLVLPAYYMSLGLMDGKIAQVISDDECEYGTPSKNTILHVDLTQDDEEDIVCEVTSSLLYKGRFMFTVPNEIMRLQS